MYADGVCPMVTGSVAEPRNELEVAKSGSGPRVWDKGPICRGTSRLSRNARAIPSGSTRSKPTVPAAASFHLQQEAAVLLAIGYLPPADQTVSRHEMVVERDQVILSAAVLTYGPHFAKRPPSHPMLVKAWINGP
jgi:hypothetical protein